MKGHLIHFTHYKHFRQEPLISLMFSLNTSLPDNIRIFLLLKKPCEKEAVKRKTKKKPPSCRNVGTGKSETSGTTHQMHGGNKPHCPSDYVAYKAAAELLRWASWQQHRSCQSLKKCLSLQRHNWFVHSKMRGTGDVTQFYFSVNWLQQQLMCSERALCWSVNEESNCY